MKQENFEKAEDRARRDAPVPHEPNGEMWGSDAIADVIRALGIPYVLINPGASFRGLHDSLVNHLGNADPQMILTLHEEHAVAIAHGYAKVAGQALAAILHSNVGLMHGSMAIFNAWADRIPVLVLGATGPVDAARRRPWIDWLHTAADQGALVRQFVKWDAQPASVPAAQEALLRAFQIANTGPRGPVYVCFDAALQEARLSKRPAIPDVARHSPPTPVVPTPSSLERATRLLAHGQRVVILAGRVSRTVQSWNERVELAEKLGARVITDLKLGASFPTAHPLHAGPSGMFLSPRSAEVLRAADVVLSLDWLDLAGTLKQAWGEQSPTCRIIQISVDHHIHNGWSMDHQALPPVDVFFPCEPDAVVPVLLADLHGFKPRVTAQKVDTMPLQVSEGVRPASDDHQSMEVKDVATTLRRVTRGEKVSLLRLPLSWSGDMWDFEGPLDFLGYDGGGGIGSGPGMIVGSALAMKGSDRLPVGIIGDGDFLMGVSAFWTAAHARIPLLAIVVNNRSFFNDELHQERVARERERPVENRWIGQRIDNPAPDLAMMARAQGLMAFGPVSNVHELERVLVDAIAAAKAGASVVVETVVAVGYSPVMSQGMTRSHGAE